MTLFSLSFFFRRYSYQHKNTQKHTKTHKNNTKHVFPCCCAATSNNMGSDGDDSNDGDYTTESDNDTETEQDVVSTEDYIIEFREPASKKRRRFSAEEKLVMIRNVDRRMHQGMSQRQACRELNIDNKQIIQWRKQKRFFMQQPNRKARSLHPGRISRLQEFEKDLL
jgi:transposase-like protein